MHESIESLEARMASLERSVRRTRIALVALGVAVAAVMGTQLLRRPARISDEIRTRRLAIIDDAGRVQVEIAQDPMNTDRRARSAGLRVFDSTGHERGGFATFDDGSVVFAMDAPHGVGDPMPDRIGLMVYPDGSTHLNMLDNWTRAVARLYTEADGGGGVQVLKWNMDAKQIHYRTLTYDGDVRETKPFGE
jgi:hypothetical protein